MSLPFQVPLASISRCFEGVIPSGICTVDEDGWPNVTYLSIVHRVDDGHVALSRQFFKKTLRDAARNPYAQLLVVDPETGQTYLLDVRHDRTETSGELFERMRTSLDAVAAYEGMTNVFRLRGVDVCEVLECAAIAGEPSMPVPPRNIGIERLEEFSRSVAGANDLDDVLQRTLDACADLVDCRHAYVMLLDEAGERLYTVASTGFEAPGTGSEVLLGEGLVGLAGERRQTIRVGNMARDLGYAHASRGAEAPGEVRSIPLPALPSGRSQLVTPMLASRQLVGVLAMESEAPGAFQAADECLAGIIASQVAMAITAIGAASVPSPMREVKGDEPGVRPVQVKYYADDESVFLDNEYLIKGVAGGILWRLLRAHEDEQRSEFSNREIRLDPTLGLPDVKDNLEARLILLRKRLEERCDYLRIEKTARGRFRLVVSRPLALVSVDGATTPRA